MKLPERYGLIGYPVKGSRSPELFAAAYGGALPYDLLEGADFESSWKRFLDGYRAVNVTAPFKERALGKVRELARTGVLTDGSGREIFRGEGAVSEACARIGASNLIVRTENGLEAHNSDLPGIVIALSHAWFPGLAPQCMVRFGEKAPARIHQAMAAALPDLFRERPQALVVGCGGAGRAAAVAAAELGFEVALMNRSPEKAGAMAAELPGYRFLTVPLSDFRAALRECDLILYTLPVALPEIASLTEKDFSAPDGQPGKVILEANYKTPAFGERLRELLTDAGGQYISGMDWLVWQAVAGYALMTGRQPDVPAILRKL